MKVFFKIFHGKATPLIIIVFLVNCFIFYIITGILNTCQVQEKFIIEIYTITEEHDIKI